MNHNPQLRVLLSMDQPAQRPASVFSLIKKVSLYEGDMYLEGMCDRIRPEEHEVKAEPTEDQDRFERRPTIVVTGMGSDAAVLSATIQSA